MDILNELPKGEILWERVHERGDYLRAQGDRDPEFEGPLKFIITSDRRREVYYIYEVHHDGITLYERLGKGKNPPDIWRKFGEVIRKACGFKEV